jgi:hypothetical protein
LFYRAGSIAPDFVRQDLIGLGIILGAVALGLILDVTTSWLVAKLILALGTLALLGAAFLSFDVFLIFTALLAIVATVLSFVRQGLARQQRVR